MSIAPLKTLLKRTESRPDTTILLKPAIHNREATVESFYFTPSIQEYFETIFDKVAIGSGAGFWVQAEYGAGKTHFLAALACLLTDNSDKLWNMMRNSELQIFRARLSGEKIFCVPINLKGEAALQGKDNLLNVIEWNIEETLEDMNIEKKMFITPTDDLIKWYEEYKFKEDIDKFIEENTKKEIKDVDNEKKARMVQEYCNKIKIRPEINISTKRRLSHIYTQIIDLGFTSMLFVIDEFASWQARHPEKSQEYAIDEEVLETLSWELPKGEGLKIFTILASQTPPPSKLVGERYKNLLLLKNETDYDAIVSFRVRELIKEKLPEIKDYYDYYYKNFKFLKNISKDYFMGIFPFQPRCFETIRGITKRDLPTVRVAIVVAWDILNEETLSENRLVTVSDFLLSSDLIKDLNNEEYKKSFEAYRETISSLKDCEFEEKERNIAERIIKTLYLWYIAHKDTPRILSETDLMEATLTSGDIVSGEDEIRYILNKLEDFPQIEYIKGKGATFKEAKEGNVKFPTIFTNLKKKNKDISDIYKYWEEGLKLTPAEAEGEESLFNGFRFGEATRRNIICRKIEYPGEIILDSHWRPEYGNKLGENMHFKIIFLTRPIDFNETLNDPRIAVCIPAEFDDNVKDVARDYWTILNMEEQYKDKVSPEDEEIRGGIKNRKKDILRKLLNKQISVYQNGGIYTQQQIGFEEKGIFISTDKLDEILGKIVLRLLTNAYSNCPIDTNKFKTIFTAKDAKKVFDGLLKQLGGASATSACENFAPVLGLSDVDSPAKFSYQDNSIFKIIRETFIKDKGELHLWKIYDILQSPYGLTRELVTLYLLGFVALGKPSVAISLRPQNRLGITKIGYPELKTLDWRGKFDDDFETLYAVSEDGWNDVIKFARIIDQSLKAVTIPEEIEIQETKLISSLNQIADECLRIKNDIKIIQERLGEEIESDKLDILYTIEKISHSKTYQEFGQNFKNKEKYINEDVFTKEYSTFEKFKKLQEQTFNVIEIASYLDRVILPEKDPFAIEKLTIKEQLSIKSLFSDPNRDSIIMESFVKFKNSYSRRYQIHHRDYYKTVKVLKDKFDDIKLNIEALSRLDRIEQLKDIGEKNLGTKYEELNSKLSLCGAKDPVSVDLNPICSSCPSPVSLCTVFPKDEAEELIRRVDKTLDMKLRRLSQMLTKKILEEDKSNKLDKLIKIIRANELKQFALNLTDELADYLNSILHKANIVTVPILKDISDRFGIIEESNIEEVVKVFRESLIKAIQEAKEKSEGKEARIILR